MKPVFKKSDFKIDTLERSLTIPSRWFVGPEFHDFDREHIFLKSWQYLGHLDRVKNSGDLITGTIAGNPVLVVRGKDMSLRAFYNVCRHRGGPLALEDRSDLKSIQCQYHGWTYTLDGHLRGVPRFDRSELFDKKDFGLVELQIETWNGFIFVRLDKSKEKLQSLVQGIAEQIAPVQLERMKFYRRAYYDVACNWKVYVDNYLEGYHLPFVHPELTSLLDYQNYKTEAFEHYSVQVTELSGTDNIYSNQKGLAFYYHLFPNFMLNILPGRLQTNLVIPISHDRCRIIFDYYYEHPDAKKAEADIAFSDLVQFEDIEICEHVQKGLESKAYDQGRFSPEMENAVYAFQSWLKKTYAKAVRK